MAVTAGRRLVAVAAGGAVGASLRYASLLAFPTVPGAFPLTIFVENVLGAFALGVLGAVLLRRLVVPLEVQVFLTTGVIGSFTTFSAVALDLVLLAQRGRWGVAVGYAAASVAGGLAAAMVGLALGRRLGGPS